MKEKLEEQNSATKAKKPRGRPRKQPKSDVLMNAAIRQIENKISEKQSAMSNFVLPNFVDKSRSILEFLGVEQSWSNLTYLYKALSEVSSEAEVYSDFASDKLISHFDEEIKQNIFYKMLEILAEEPE